MGIIKKTIVIGTSFLLIGGAIEAATVICKEDGQAHLKENIITVKDARTTVQEEETIKLPVKDIYKGKLIVVNNSIPYEFNGDQSLVSVYDNKTSSYFVKDKNVLLDQEIFTDLNAMMDSFYEYTNQKEINIVSGYRTKAYQQVIYNQNVEENGAVHAMNYVANAGYSEHHTGLAIDFGCFNEERGTSARFDGENELKWFTDNCHRYGFILRYPKNKKEVTGISYEPWHFRYVGVPHSYAIKKNEFCLEEYIAFLKENTSSEKRLNIQTDDQTYDVYYSKNREVKVPKGKDYEVSGDNKEGYIVTIKN